ncbi:hypothetical protein D4764_08G0006410 [Takifugu flavidus]|uniref:Uncharacterized protein n=1 Tax=Takifugu flavidus TaxID=433684 RepID=A0A5C6MN31_9TELE|nr:hypothetical protein D4764_08G0006410 [Takifugu flavidus]
MVKRPVDILPLIHHVKKKAQLQEESGFRMSAASLLNQPPRHSLHCVTLHFWTQTRSFPPSLRDRLWQCLPHRLPHPKELSLLFSSNLPITYLQGQGHIMGCAGRGQQGPRH